MGRQRPIGKVLEDLKKLEESNTAEVKVTKPLGERGVRFQEGNPGRPVGSRQKLAEAFLRDLYEEWGRRKTLILQELAPADYVRAVVATLPRQLEITQEHIYEIRDTPMNADEWQKSCVIEHEPEIIPESDSVN